MKTKIVMTSLIAGALLAPMVGYTADGDSVRSLPYPVLMEAMDPALTSQIKEKVGAKMSYKVNVSIDTDKNGVVFLSGNARNQAEVAQVESIARSVKGVTSVQNTIQIAPPTRVSGFRN